MVKETPEHAVMTLRYGGRRTQQKWGGFSQENDVSNFGAKKLNIC